MDGVVVKRMKLVCAMARFDFIKAKKEVVVVKTPHHFCGVFTKESW
jgi:hypothetical protein